TTPSRGAEARGNRAELSGCAGRQSLARSQSVTTTRLGPRSFSHPFRACDTAYRSRASSGEGPGEWGPLRAPADDGTSRAHAWARSSRAELPRVRLGTAGGNDRRRRSALRGAVLTRSRDAT